MAIDTNKDYLIKSLAKFNVTEDDVDILLLDSPELGGYGQGAVNVKACKLAIYKSMSSVLPIANVSESQFSVSWNYDALKLWYAALCKELGKPNLIKPAIRNRSNFW